MARLLHRRPLQPLPAPLLLCLLVFPVGADFSMVVAPLPSGAPPVLEHAKRPLPPHPSFDDESRPAVKARKDPVPYGDPGGAGGRKPCGCKNSKCLKLYCDCFAIGEYCKGCLCVGCHNNVAFEQERQHAMDQIRKKDKTAFTQKVTLQGGHLVGNCTPSRCLKRYCECFRGGVPCGIKCRCIDCGNTFGTCPRGGNNESVAAAACRMRMRYERQHPQRHPKSWPRGPGRSLAIARLVKSLVCTSRWQTATVQWPTACRQAQLGRANGGGLDDESVADANNLLVDDGNPEAYPHEGLCTVKLGKRQLLWPCWLTPAVAGAESSKAARVCLWCARAALGEPGHASRHVERDAWHRNRATATHRT